MTTLAGSDTHPGRGALRRRRSWRPQGPSPSLLLAMIPIALLSVLTLASLRAWSALRPSLAALSGPPRGPLLASRPMDRGPGHLSPAFTPQVLRWANKIQSWSLETGLDPNLIAVVMQIESCGDPGARSPSGALGLFQVMPYHFLPGDAPLDPDTNARRGLRYLSRSLELAKTDPRLALAGYNGGHTLIDQASPNWPAETQRYVAWGTGLLDDIANGREPSPTLSRWLRAGGDALCDQTQGAQPPARIAP